MSDNWVVRIGRAMDFEGYRWCLTSSGDAIGNEAGAALRMSEATARQLASNITYGKAIQILDGAKEPGAFQHHAVLALSHLKCAMIVIDKARNALPNSVSNIVLDSLAECDDVYNRLVELEEMLRPMVESDI